MFERYNERARRAIFFARYEASQFGSSSIESEHLLLGLIQEDKALMSRLLTPEDAESIRLSIQSREKNLTKIPTDRDLPLSEECKRILGNAAEQADQLSDQHIGTEHLLLGLLSQKSSTAELLTQRGVTAEKVLQSQKKSPSAERPKTERPKRRASNPPPPWSWPDAT
jgi:ATP-dependent Clp protease ATP-binding subunit ClpC